MKSPSEEDIWSAYRLTCILTPEASPTALDVCYTLVDKGFWDVPVEFSHDDPEPWYEAVRLVADTKLVGDVLNLFPH